MADAGVLTVSQYAAALLGFLTNVIAARALGPTNFGVAALLMTFPILVMSFMSAKTISVTTRYLASLRASERFEPLLAICRLGFAIDLTTAFIASLIVALSGWAVVAGFYDLSPRWVVPMILFSLSLLPYAFIGTGYAVLTAWNKFRLLATLYVLDAAVVLACVAATLLTQSSVEAVVLGTALGQALFGLAVLVFVSRFLNRLGAGSWFRSRSASLGKLRGEVRTLLGWNYLLVTFGSLVAQVPVLLIGEITGAKEAGYFRLALTVVTAASALEASMSRVVMPILSVRWSRGERLALQETLRTWTLRSGISVSLMLLICTPFAPAVISQIFGDRFDPVGMGVQVMLLGAAVSSSLFWVNSLLVAAGRIDILAKMIGLQAVLVILVGVFAAQRWGFLGMCVVWTASKIVTTIWLARKASTQLHDALPSPDQEEAVDLSGMDQSSSGPTRGRGGGPRGPSL